MADLERDEELKSKNQVIMDKYVDIRKLKDILSWVKFMISFLEHENMQLKFNQLTLNRHKVDASKEAVKGKAIVQVDDPYEHEE